MQEYFLINEDFEKIIYTTLSERTNVKEIQELSFISTGWTNIVYKVRTEEGNYFFRFPRDVFWEKTIVKDYQFAKYINNKTSFTTVDLKLHYDNGRPFSFHKEIEGTPLAEKMDCMNTDEIAKVSTQIAQFMYELHNLKFKQEDVFNISNIGLNLNDFIDELLSVHVSRRDMEFWKEHNFRMKEENYCLVHGDLNSSNILLDNNNNIAAVIDFGFGGFGNEYFDIARIIGRCPETFKKPISKAYENLANSHIDEKELDENIYIWNNIDSAYINYMRKIGIYK